DRLGRFGDQRLQADPAPDDACEPYERAQPMTVAPRSGAAPPLDIAETIERARAAWRAGRADEAEMACRQVLAVWPGQADASYLLGLMAHHYGNLDLAIAHMRQACQSPRAPAHFYSDFAEMCRQDGLFAEGEQAARRAVALAPNFAAAWNNLGIILQEMLKLDESRLCLERALALEPGNAETLKISPTPSSDWVSRRKRRSAGPRPSHSGPTTPRPTATFPTFSTTRGNMTAPRPRRARRWSSTRASPTP